MSDLLTLKASGSERALPKHYLGANSPVTYSIPYEDPAFVPAVRELAPGLLRFPGGTVANYWNWRTQRMEIPRVEQGASIYRTFLYNAEGYSWKMHPKGISVERFRELCDQIGCDFTFLPNLESSSVAEQEAWFADMHAKGVVPKMIEMGNEFYISLLGDALTKSIFPDWATTRRITLEYLDAFKKYLPADAKIAVQVASSRLHHLEDPGAQAGYFHDEWVWDDAMGSEGWFQAVISHPYATPEGVVSGEVLKEMPATLDILYPALIARADEGYERAFAAVREKVPDKEIWVTEWGQFSSGATFAGVRQRLSGLWLHLIARAAMSQLREPAVTASTMHALFFDGGLMSLFRPKTGGGYEMIGNAGLLRWFHDAVNGGATYRAVLVEGAKRIVGQGRIREGFADVMACLLRKGGESTLLVHNAGRGAKRLRLSDLLRGTVPAKAEAIVTADLLAPTDEGLLPVTPLGGGGDIEIPGYAFARVVWPA